jgi:hypothetical protein
VIVRLIGHLAFRRIANAISPVPPPAGHLLVVFVAVQPQRPQTTEAGGINRVASTGRSTSAGEKTLPVLDLTPVDRFRQAKWRYRTG